MAIGAGKYDNEATLVRERTKAKGVLIIVIGGDKGEGFACQADLTTTLAIPKMLRHVADQIEADFNAAQEL